MGRCGKLVSWVGLSVWLLASGLMGPEAVRAQNHGSGGRETASGGADRSPVNLAKWAEENGLKTRKGSRPTELVLFSRWAEMLFRSEDKKVVLDGIEVALCFPVTMRGDDFFVRQVDIDKTLRPVVRPTRWKEGRQLTKIAISAGHGGRDNGKQVDRKSTRLNSSHT